MCSLKDDVLFKDLKKGYLNGYITKDEYALTLRRHQAACDEMKSESGGEVTADGGTKKSQVMVEKPKRDLAMKKSQK